MFKKVIAWIKTLFTPLKIEEHDVDQFIQAQRRNHNQQDTVLSVKVREGKETVTTPASTPVVPQPVVAKAPATPPKSLNEQLKDVELPVYARGKKLPPKAKRQFIERKNAIVQSYPARGQSLRRTEDNSSSSPVDPMSAALLTAVVVSNDTPTRVEECRSSSSSSHDTDYSSSSHSSSHDSYSSSSSSHSSYDSSSYDSGSSSYSSCD